MSSTITAICTAQGNGAISMIRVSGPEAYDIVGKIFRPLRTNLDFEADAQKNHFYNGYIIDSDGETLDRVVVLAYRAPNSYTGEDTVEISCHASIYIQHQILKLLIANGAVPAEPGEFTRRAFVNKKMDLSQAEAVADLIASKSKADHQIAINQMRGGITNEIRRLRELLLKFTSLMELELDFSEEDVEFADRTQLNDILSETDGYLTRLIDSFNYGNAIKNGVPVAICGQPNAGKSTLLNALLNDERAIVSDIPGTTRDILEDTIIIKGVTYRLIDTAGIRETDDRIESLGIDRAKSAMQKARIVILLLDAQYDLQKQIDDVLPKDLVSDVVAVVNKCDVADVDVSALSDFKKVIKISAKNRTNIQELTDILASLASSDYSAGDVILTNIRHLDIFSKARESLRRGYQALRDGLSGEFVSQDIREVLRYFADITGDEITTDEVLGNIFKNFCIGK